MSIAIYDKDDHWTEEAKDAVKRFDAVMKPVFDELVTEGFNSRELSWLLIDQVRVHEIYSRLAKRFED